jgi:hypothetical protein
MNKNEIRYKNYVSHHGLIRQISGFRTYSTNHTLVRFEMSGGEYMLDSLEPVKLTEELALKLDFEKDNSENNKTYLSPRVNGSRMKIYFNRFGIAKFTTSMFHQVEIKNVHTLQNLFFALYGSELVFSTEP